MLGRGLKIEDRELRIEDRKPGLEPSSSLLSPLSSLLSPLIALCVLYALSSGLSVGQDQTIKLESGLVAVDVTVLDQRGNYVTGLSEKDFVILHDGVPQPIAFFESQMTPTLTRPLAVVFALDISASLGTQIADQQSAAGRFVVLVQAHSVFAVIGFNDRVHIFQKFTSDPERVKRAFAKAKQFRRFATRYEKLKEVYLGVARLVFGFIHVRKIAGSVNTT